MKRCIVTLASLCLLVPLLSACGGEADKAAADMEVPQGKRPVPAEKRPPPGPPNAKVVTEEDAGKKGDDGGNDDE